MTESNDHLDKVLAEYRDEKAARERHTANQQRRADSLVNRVRNKVHERLQFMRPRLQPFGMRWDADSTHSHGPTATGTKLVIEISRASSMDRLPSVSMEFVLEEDGRIRVSVPGAGSVEPMQHLFEDVDQIGDDQLDQLLARLVAVSLRAPHDRLRRT